MGNVVYRCVRRIVNVLAFIMLLTTISILVYMYCTKALEQLEIILTSRRTDSTRSTLFLNYNMICSLFMAMISSTSVNSKSKFTLKIAIIFGLFYTIYIGGIGAYIYMVYMNKIQNEILHSVNPNENTFVVLISSVLQAANPHEDFTNMSFNEVMKRASALCTKELTNYAKIFAFTAGLGLLMTLLMIVGINSKISKDKKTDVPKVSIVETKTVGWSTPAESLRRKIQKQSA